MIKVTVKDGEIAIRYLGDMSQQARRTIATALTETAWIGQRTLREDMKRVFDRPTRYALNSLSVQKAGSATLTAKVYFRDAWDKGVPAAKFMAPEVFGGARSHKRSESQLIRAGKMPAGRFLVPGAKAELDAYGSQKSGQIVKAISALKAFGEVGYLANRNEKKRGRGKRKGELYFAIGGGSHLHPGVYQRTGSGGASGGTPRGIAPVMAFVRAPSYAPRLPMAATVEAVVVREFPAQFQRALDRAAARGR
ncbi:hypothetical protein ACIU1J_01880 [Azospirillum doebereinerae]|uniref:hypothetical protein n=1 Tax=Azospirillum doebereinerae TaxID=92933 RepID=UPI001EE5346D|nr:hypothetical protein [Azospirillum doebereinerae]MCG5240081.1 hypothetical protein [Azospirillum doebereinerae]